MDTIQEKIHAYFKLKTQEILTLSKQAGLIDHNGLRGTNREDILCQLLRDIFPRKYSIDHGMVYGFFGNSREADIVIWDELNYPKLKLASSSLFFYEGVKVIIEIKSRWSSEEFADIKNKVSAATNIFPGTHKQGLSGQLKDIKADIYGLRSENVYEGQLISPRRIGMAAVIYQGGQNFNIEDLDNIELEKIEDQYPDIMLFLEAKKVILKEFISNNDDPSTGYGVLEQVECGDDALLVFVSVLLDLLVKHSEHLEPPLSLRDYLFDLGNFFQRKQVEFNLTRPIAGSSVFIWG